MDRDAKLARRLLDRLMRGEALSGPQMLFLYRHADEAEVERVQAEAASKRKWRRAARR